MYGGKYSHLNDVFVIEMVPVVLALSVLFNNTTVIWDMIAIAFVT